MLDLPKNAALALRALPRPREPHALLDALRGDAGGSHSRYPWLLESALPSARIGRFTFAGADPYLVVRARGERVELECRRPVRPGLAPGRLALEADPLEVVRALLPSLAAQQAPQIPFVGGAVGYLGYELAARFEPVVFHGADELGLPDLVLLFVDRVAALDHETGVLFACGLGFGEGGDEARARAERAAEQLCAELRRPRAPQARAASRRRAKSEGCGGLDGSAYAKAVDAILQEIGAGNVYQACLTHRLERDFGGDPWALYRRLCALNPGPFASFLELPEVAIASSSPERFLRVDPERRVESRPIKGTRPRGCDPAEDEALRLDLGASAKDRAENLMIVDLVRNDLGRVCETGSVEVPELMAIEPYASVFQMVSTVSGRLREDRDALDLLRATFPPGSMTGAPKIAAMRLLDRLEPRRRGIYSGALGYLDARGGADLSVVIRAILVCRGRAYLHCGGGIVADSDPAGEWRESLDKAALLLAALDAG